MIEVKIWTKNEFLDPEIAIVFFERFGEEICVFNFYTRSKIMLKDSQPCPEEYILKIPGFLSQNVFLAFANAMDKQGVKTENDFKIAGKLEAVKSHLEDLREMLKLSKKD